jgi:hypothetical protein
VVLDGGVRQPDEDQGLPSAQGANRLSVKILWWASCGKVAAGVPWVRDSFYSWYPTTGSSCFMCNREGNYRELFQR